MNTIIWTWFSLTAISVAYIGYDLFARTPEMKVMKWGWLLVSLYTGPVALLVYLFSCREPSAGTHERFIAPMWKQSVGSTIHCLAGDATGVIVAAGVTTALGFPMWLDSVAEYVAGCLFGLLVFQALFMKSMLGGSYWHAVKSTWLAEWLSMNCVMTGMFPVMVIWMTRDMDGMHATSPRFWFIMSMATLAGAVTGYPVNVWLVKNKLKHGMGTVRALGRGGTPVEPERAREHDMKRDGAKGMEEQSGPDGSVSAARKAVVAAVTVVLLFAGIVIAARFGDLSMKRDAPAMPPGDAMKAGRHSRLPSPGRPPPPPACQL